MQQSEEADLLRRADGLQGGVVTGYLRGRQRGEIRSRSRPMRPYRHMDEAEQVEHAGGDSLFRAPGTVGPAQPSLRRLAERQQPEVAVSCGRGFVGLVDG